MAETEPGEQAAGRLRLGTDEGAEICVDATGRVQAVFVQADAPSMHVSSGVEAFAARALRSPHLFVQDDLWISLYLRVGPDRPLDVAQLVEFGALEDASVNRADMS